MKKILEVIINFIKKLFCKEVEVKESSTDTTSSNESSPRVENGVVVNLYEDKVKDYLIQLDWDKSFDGVLPNVISWVNENKKGTNRDDFIAKLTKFSIDGFDTKVKQIDGVTYITFGDESKGIAITVSGNTRLTVKYNTFICE